jgi:hypothetical protein
MQMGDLGQEYNVKKMSDRGKEKPYYTAGRSWLGKQY